MIKIKCKLALTLLLMMSSMFMFAQKDFPKEFTDINEAKKYLAEHILELDPIEGIYDAENIVNASAGRYKQTVKQHMTWVILNLSKVTSGWKSDYQYIVYSAKGDVNGISCFINTITKGSYYTMYVPRESGLESFRFKLENGVMFSINDKKYYNYENAAREISTSAIKSYPTVQMYQAAIYEEQSKKAASSGTGFLIGEQGYVLTNYHVIENAQNGNIKITGINDDNSTSYKASVEITDKQNDLAILKITPHSRLSMPYSFRFNTASVGEECFVLGYPLISTMGKDIKLTTGIISSKTGFDGNIAQYQISAPVQPGNSGGPLFDKNGNIIGIVQAKHTQAENAGYAIKSSYIRNLVELLPTSISFPQTSSLNGKTLPQQVELASKAVCLIIVNGN